MYRAVPVAGGARARARVCVCVCVCTCCRAEAPRNLRRERLARKVAICNYYHRYLVRPAANRDGLIKARGLTPQTQPVSRSRAARGPSPINSECNDGR